MESPVDCEGVEIVVCAEKAGLKTWSNIESNRSAWSLNFASPLFSCSLSLLMAWNMAMQKKMFKHILAWAKIQISTRTHSVPWGNSPCAVRCECQKTKSARSFYNCSLTSRQHWGQKNHLWGRRQLTTSVPGRAQSAACSSCSKGASDSERAQSPIFLQLPSLIPTFLKH